MRAVVFHGVGDIRLDDVSGPTIQEPTDAIVRITATALCGTALHNTLLASTAVGAGPDERAGMASGTNNTFRQVGIATGIAALGAIFEHRAASSLADSLTGTPAGGGAEALARVVSSGNVRSTTSELLPDARARPSQAGREAFVGALNTLFLVSAVVALVGAILALVLIRGRGFERGGSHPDVEAPQAERPPAGVR